MSFPRGRSRAIWLAKKTGIGGRIIVTMPPRHGKSELVSHWTPAWYLHNWPQEKVILTTYEADYSLSWGRKVRNTLTYNDEIRTYLAKDSKAAGAWETDLGGGMVTAGVGGPITGRGGHLIIIDDPHKNWAEAQSKKIRENIIDWFNSTLYTRCEPAATIILLQTRWHERDLAGYLLNDHKDNWTEVRLPALAEGDDPLGRAEGEALCPERYDRDALLKIKRAVGSQVWAGLYQQRPAPMEGNIWKLSWWNFYRERPAFQYLVQSWDTGFKKGEENSYTVGQTWGIAKNGYYLIDQVRDRLEYPDLKRRIKVKYDRFRPRIVLVEDKASGISVVQDLKRETKIPIKPVKVSSEQDKIVRSQLASPAAEAGLIYLPEKAPWLDDYLDEMTAFPNSEFTDQADCTSQAIEYLHQKRARIVSGARIISS
ncbi:MAG: phage terminase large subunit [Deltaproteobacteria bacterium]|nr:phage terminase large subunit [Deltaproteobacteria bacterium]